MKGHISGEVALAEFRARLTGRYGLELLQQHGAHVLVQLPVGVGKSRWLDENVAAADLTPAPATLAALDRIFAPGAAAGARYSAEERRRVEL